MQSAPGSLLAGVLAAEGPSPLLPHTSELIVGLIAFAILFAFLARKVFPRFEQAFQARQEAIQGGIERAEAAQAEAAAALQQYRAQLADARAEAARIRDAAREQGQLIVEEMRASAQAEAARITARGEEQLRAERQQIVNELRSDIGRLAVDLAGRIVGESLEDEARRRGTVERFLTDLERTSQRAAPEAGSPDGSTGGAAVTGSARVDS